MTKLSMSEEEMLKRKYTRPYEKRIADLEKENAKLKETVIKMNNVITETFSNLTKAKEIIKTFCGFCSVFNSTNGSFDNLIAEAEQFLSEVEK